MVAAKKGKRAASKLTPKQQRFVQEYLIDLNGTQAAARAGYSQKTAEVQANQLLKKPWVAEAVAKAQLKRSQRVEMTQDEVFRRWVEIATADPNELVQFRRHNCRHCWGAKHGYQWTAGEYAKAQREAIEKGKPEPQLAGGLGFVSTREPNPSCPECGGEGYGHIHVNDTRKLSPAARLLYAGVKQGKDGLEVRMHDQMKALENVARHLGMIKQQHEVTGKAGGPMRVVNESADVLRKLSNEQLAQLEGIAAAIALAGSGGDSRGTSST